MNDKALRIDVAEVIRKVAPTAPARGLFYLYHHKPERHDCTITIGSQPAQQYDNSISNEERIAWTK